jgi:hypothetical protein
MKLRPRRDAVDSAHPSDTRSASAPTATEIFISHLDAEIRAIDADLARTPLYLRSPWPEYTLALLCALAIDGIIITIPTGHPGTTYLTPPLAGLAGLIGVFVGLSTRFAPAVREDALSTQISLDQTSITALAEEVARLLRATEPIEIAQPGNPQPTPGLASM